MNSISRFALFLLIYLPIQFGQFALLGCKSPSQRSAMSNSSSTPKDKPQLLTAWIEYAPNLQLIVKAITSDSLCPLAQLDTPDHKTLSLSLRVQPTPQFPVMVCEASIPSLDLVTEGVKKIRVGEIDLKVPNPQVRRILVLGDTGCRIKVAKDGFTLIQDCSKPESWAFSSIVKSAAEWQPDLVIHVGDYLYRESICPEKNTFCEGSPAGDSWATWEADFFQPAKELLSKAPWIFVRGNHESCERAHEGWFRFLDPRPYALQCNPLTPTYHVPLGSFSVAVLDTSETVDHQIEPTQVASIKEQFLQMKNASPPVKWILTHKPFWLGYRKSKDAPGTLENKSQTLAEAARQSPFLSKVNLLLTGHEHLFNIRSFEDRGPIQIITGNGGTQLKSVPSDDLAGLKIKNRIIKHNITLETFGFLTFEATESTPRNDHWKMVEHAVDGTPTQTCELKRQSISCSKK